MMKLVSFVVGYVGSYLIVDGVERKDIFQIIHGILLILAGLKLLGVW